MEDQLENPQTIESSYWESSYTRFAQFGWLIVVLGVMALIASLAGDLHRNRGPATGGNIRYNR